MTPDDWADYRQLADRKAARQQEVLEQVAADYRRRTHGPPRLADKATGMPPRKRKDRPWQ